MSRSCAAALVLFVLGSLSALAGCGAASDAASAATESKTTTLHGTWRNSEGEPRPASVVFEQEALAVRATIVMQGHRCMERSVVEAKLTTSGVEATATVGKMVLHLSGDPDLSEVVGNFEAAVDGPCAGDHGWLAVAR
jgi:hypothetical protein